MPYSSDGSDVPDYVPKSKKKQWAAVWNSSYNTHGSEERAFREANAVAGPNASKLAKFGTSLTGFTKGEFGPFKCGHCKFSKEFLDDHICTNPDVADDEAVPEDEYGNKKIESEDCCNFYTPLEEEL